MPNPFKKWFNQYLYFIKKDRIALLILSVLTLVAVISNWIVRRSEPKSVYDYSNYSLQIEEWERSFSKNNADNKRLFAFNPNTISEEALDSLNLTSFVKQNILSYRNAGGSFSEPVDIRKIYGINDSIYSRIEPFIEIPEQIDSKEHSGKEIKTEHDYHGFFDPNKANIQELVKFGFTVFQAENLVKYRESGGFYQSRNDLLKIYGIDSMFLKSIEKNIQIEPHKENIAFRKDTIIWIELNSADTTALMSLPGIGPVFAQRILKYREILGGYYSKSQLLEVYNFPLETFQKIERNIIIDTVSIQKIRINYAGFSDLVKHPYLDKNMANAILKEREKNGAFTLNEQIQSIPEIDQVTFSRIRPYITCR